MSTAFGLVVGMKEDDSSQQDPGLLEFVADFGARKASLSYIWTPSLESLANTFKAFQLITQKQP